MFVSLKMFIFFCRTTTNKTNVEKDKLGKHPGERLSDPGRDKHGSLVLSLEVKILNESPYVPTTVRLCSKDSLGIQANEGRCNNQSTPEYDYEGMCLARLNVVCHSECVVRECVR